MPFIGAANKTRATKTTIDHKYYLGGHADTIANPGYYTFYVHYVPGNITVIVRGIHMAESDYIATNGTDVRINQSDITLNSDDSIELIGFGMPAADILQRSDVSITGGQAINLEKVDAKYYMIETNIQQTYMFLQVITHSLQVQSTSLVQSMLREC